MTSDVRERIRELATILRKQAVDILMRQDATYAKCNGDIAVSQTNIDMALGLIRKANELDGLNERHDLQGLVKSNEDA